MADYTKNLMVKVHDVLAAESTVLALLHNGADGILYWQHPELHDMAGRPVPFINILPGDSSQILELSDRRDIAASVIVEYYFPDRPDETQLDVFADINVIEGFLFGADLLNPSFSGEGTFIDGSSREFDVDAGHKIVRWETVYNYRRNK